MQTVWKILARRDIWRPSWVQEASLIQEKKISKWKYNKKEKDSLADSDSHAEFHNPGAWGTMPMELLIWDIFFSS